MFNTFKKILKKEEVTDEDLAKVSDWILMQWLSGDRVGVQFAQIFNTYPQMPLRAKIELLLTGLPKIGYIKYPKREKEDDRIIDMLIKHFQINRKTAHEYYIVLSTDDIADIESYYSKGTQRK